jgi:hypothetical protein
MAGCLLAVAAQDQTQEETMKRMTFAAGIFIALALLGLAGTASAGVTGPAFYVDGRLFRTVNTPTDLTNTGAPDHSFDTIYDLGGVQMNVATAKPGDRDYNGGRWQVHAVAFPGGYNNALADAGVDLNNNEVLDSDAELLAAISEGYARDDGIVKRFVCPVIKLSKGQY